MKKPLGGFEIVDNDEDVVHPLKRHILPSLASLLMPVPAHATTKKELRGRLYEFWFPRRSAL